MSEIQFEPLDEISAQEILDDRGVEVTVSNLRGIVNDDGFELQGYDVESEDEIDLCDILNLSFDQPVICERRDVENSISEAEYQTLKTSDDRRGQEVKELQESLRIQKSANANMFKLVQTRDQALGSQALLLRACRAELKQCKKRWYTKIQDRFLKE